MEGLFSFTTEFCRWGGTLLQVWYPIPKWNYQWSKQKQETANSADDCNESLMWFISFGWSQSVFATPSISAIIQQCHLVSQLGISNKSNARYQMRLAREVDCLRMAYFQLVIKKWKKICITIQGFKHYLHLYPKETVFFRYNIHSTRLETIMQSLFFWEYW